MRKIINFCKEKYKILIPIMVGIVLLSTILFVYKEYQYENTRNKKEVSVFQYFGGVKTEYTGIITYNLKGAIVEIGSNNKNIHYDSTPIYYNDENKIIFPNVMSIVFPLRDAMQYRLFKYSTYSFSNDLHYIKSNTDTGIYNNFFLFDGINMFFFPDEVTLRLDSNDYKKIGAGSYVSVVGGLTLVYYDRATDSSELVELNGRNVSVVNDNLDVNISERYFMSFGRKVLLFNPDNLDPVFKTIDN